MITCTKCPPIPAKVQWMPIVPFQHLAINLPCYTQKLCINKQGVRFKGLRCCKEMSPDFKMASSDLHNYVPENSLIKQQRKMYRFSEETADFSQNKKCHFSINKKNKTIDISPLKRGMVARIYLYMKDTYHLSLSEKEIALYLKWHRQYPVDAWEIERNKKIKAVQGNVNFYVEN